MAEALAGAGTASLDNVILHLDWNQASIDSDRVCRDRDQPGDYVQWTPMELFYLHDWNVINVPDGHDMSQVLAAQTQALSLASTQPTAIVYRTVKGWQYGIEGRKSHGAGHKLCSDAFYDSLGPFLEASDSPIPRCCNLTIQRCSGSDGAEIMEECFFNSLKVLRGRSKSARRWSSTWPKVFGNRDAGWIGQIVPRCEGCPQVEQVYKTAAAEEYEIPEELRLQPGTKTTLRGELGRALGYYNKKSGGSLMCGGGGPSRFHQRGSRGQGLSRRIFQREQQPRIPDPLRGWYLRGRDLGGALRAGVLRPSHRSGLVLRGVHGPARAHLGPAPRHREPGPYRKDGRTLPAHDPDLRHMPD